jgi:hypothetical protein
MIVIAEGERSVLSMTENMWTSQEDYHVS